MGNGMVGGPHLEITNNIFKCISPTDITVNYCQLYKSSYMVFINSTHLFLPYFTEWHLHHLGLLHVVLGLGHEVVVAARGVVVAQQ